MVCGLQVKTEVWSGRLIVTIPSQGHHQKGKRAFAVLGTTNNDLVEVHTKS